MHTDSAMGNYLGALQRFRHIHMLQDSIHKKNSARLSAYYQTELEIETNIEALKTEEIKSERKSIVILASIIIGVLITLIVYLWLTRRNQKNKNRFQQEKTEVGNDIHDSINPMLSYVRMTIARINASDEPNKEKLAEMVQVLDSSITEVRKLSAWIRRTSDFEKFNDSLSEMLNSFSEAYSLKIDLSYDLDELKLTSILKHNLYYILEELVLNTWKHSGATKIEVSVFIKAHQLVMRYGDNGRGFAFSKDFMGTGLSSIKERVKRLSGRVDYRHLDENSAMSYLLFFEFPILFV